MPIAFSVCAFFNEDFISVCFWKKTDVQALAWDWTGHRENVLATLYNVKL